MRIAFTYNLQLSDSEEEAEFDRPETVAAIAVALRSLGHEVEPVEVSGPASRVVARLEALWPDLIFNTAEGTRGRFREAFHPALFDRLGIPFTGSDAYVCVLTLDKQLTKLVVMGQGVLTPKWKFLDARASVGDHGLRFPIIAKPNFEGSSMGITVDSVVDNDDDLRRLVRDLQTRFSAGVLIEEFIVGRDLVVPFLEKASPETGGVLAPASYDYLSDLTRDRKYQLYDYELKTLASDTVTVKVPADITPAQSQRLIEVSRVVFRSLGIRDLGRLDFRLADSGELYFLEANALPSLEAGASIYESAALAGLGSRAAVLDAVVRSAAERFGIPYKASRRSRPRAKLKVGLTFNLRRQLDRPDGVAEDEAEYDAPGTITALKEAIESYGYEVIELEATPELSSLLPASGVDVVFNIAEGFAGRTRESQVPALLELLGIPYTGSDPTAISLALDKALAKRLVIEAGLPTPPFVIMASGKERLPKGWTFPAIVKPIAEGSSKGVVAKSVVNSEAELRESARQMAAKYRQPVLAEVFLPGREFTVALLGEKRPRVLPPLEILFTDPTQQNPVYSFDKKFRGESVAYQTPANVTPALQREIERVARGSFIALGCRDVARVDLRLDAEGRVNFIECNPLPGLAPGFSDLCVIAAGAGMDYRALVGEIMAPALRRLRERRKERNMAPVVT
jgi:D-alanine-D-alanine ligase